MRKQLRSTLIASAALILLAMSPSWAAPDGALDSKLNAPEQVKKVKTNLDAPGQVKKVKNFEAPEIDIGAGGAGIAVLVIALLLAAERRSRSS
jgi:hypothetical protein